MFVELFCDEEGLRKLAVILNDGCPRALTNSSKPTCPKDLVAQGNKTICKQCWERYLRRHAKIMPAKTIKEE